MLEGYNPACLERIEPRSFWFRARNRLIVSTLARLFPAPRSILELGCGTGFVLAGLRAAFPGARLVGVDPSAEGLEIARRRVPDAELVHGGAESVDVVDTFDIACAFDVLEHLADDADALRRLRRAVHAGAGLLILVPQHRWLWSDADELGGHYRRYSRRGLLTLVRDAGFEPVQATSFVATLLPFMIAARLGQWVLRSRRHDPWAELVPPLGLNRLFEEALDAERILINRGLSFPAGGSLLLAARAA